jgi:hypothetical protein
MWRIVECVAEEADEPNGEPPMTVVLERDARLHENDTDYWVGLANHWAGEGVDTTIYVIGRTAPFQILSVQLHQHDVNVNRTFASVLAVTEFISNHDTLSRVDADALSAAEFWQRETTNQVSLSVLKELNARFRDPAFKGRPFSVDAFNAEVRTQREFLDNVIREFRDADHTMDCRPLLK